MGSGKQLFDQTKDGKKPRSEKRSADYADFADSNSKNLRHRRNLRRLVFRTVGMAAKGSGEQTDSPLRDLARCCGLRRGMRAISARGEIHRFKMET
jgi:hypothetical protein